jgi:hypothetical protein
MKCVVYALLGDGKSVPPMEFDPIPAYIVLLSDWHPDFYRRQFDLLRIDKVTNTAYYSENQSQYKRSKQ